LDEPGVRPFVMGMVGAESGNQYNDMSHKLSTKLEENLKSLAAMPDDEIDYSDIPPLPDELWEKAVRNPFYRPTKNLNDGSGRLGCAGLAQVQGKGLSDANQRHPA
jgi:hypothetical protein